MRVWKVISFAIIGLLIALGPNFAQNLPPPVPLASEFHGQAPQAILIDGLTGAVLYEKDADCPVDPASMSKLMTALMIMERLQEGSLRADQELVVSTKSWRQGGAPSGGTTMYAAVNSKVKVLDLLRGLIIVSANDAALAFAEALSGNEASFIVEMAARARALGLKSAVFKNVTGFSAPGQQISARDLSVLARKIIYSFPDYYKIYSEREMSWNKITQRNRNPLLVDYQGADGLQTGYNKQSGYGLVGSVVRNGRRLIVVVAGLKGLSERKQEVDALLNWGFNQFKPVILYKPGEKVGWARVWGGESRSVVLFVKDAMTAFVSPQERETASVELNYQGPLAAPLAENTKIGNIIVRAQTGEILAQSAVFSATEIAETTSKWSKAFDSLLVMFFGG